MALRQRYEQVIQKRVHARQASCFLTLPYVRTLIEQNEKEAYERLNITRDHVIKELAKVAFVDVRKLYNENGSLKQMDELDEDTAAAFAGVETDELFEWQGDTKVKIGEK